MYESYASDDHVSDKMCLAIHSLCATKNEPCTATAETTKTGYSVYQIAIKIIHYANNNDRSFAFPSKFEGSFRFLSIHHYQWPTKLL